MSGATGTPYIVRSVVHASEVMRAFRSSGEALRLRDVVERTGLVTHQAAVDQMREADVLLFILGPEPASRGILSGKLPEYLAAGKMILGLAPDGVATDVIRRSGVGVVVDPDDVEGVVAALRSMHKRWQSGEPQAPDPHLVDEFNRERTMDRLDVVLSDLQSQGAWRDDHRAAYR